MVVDGFSDDELTAIEREHVDGVSSVQIVDFFQRKGVRFSEATLRKYVQLGLLPRSRRVGLKSKQRGSTGLYPVTVIRSIWRLKMMLASHSIEEIQRRYLFVRPEVEALERTLETIFSALEGAVRAKSQQGSCAPADSARIGMSRELSDTRALAVELVGRITGMESRVMMQARLRSVG